MSTSVAAIETWASVEGGETVGVSSSIETTAEELLLLPLLPLLLLPLLLLLLLLPLLPLLPLLLLSLCVGEAAEIMSELINERARSAR